MDDLRELVTRQHLRILKVLAQKPTATNEDIGAALGGKSAKTIENQLGAIYKRLKLTGENRRIALVMLLREHR